MIKQLLISYLTAYVFWSSIAIGALGLLLLHAVTGGAWGDLIKPQMRAAATTLPALGILFVPILFGIKILYPWAQASAVVVDPIFQHQQIYLNIPFFCARTIFYFALWSFLAYKGNERISAPGLLAYGLTLTFAATDWMMSIEAHWYSTIYGVLVMISAALNALAFLTVGLHVFQKPQARENPLYVKPYHDLGNMMLAFVMFWAYISFSQYLVIWSGNLPDEIPWYLHRQEGGWFSVAMVMILFEFFLPFLVLLGRRNKQELARLVKIAWVLLAIGIVHIFWLIEPSYFPGVFHVHWLDPLVFVIFGGVWLVTFRLQLKKQPTLVGTYVTEATE